MADLKIDLISFTCLMYRTEIPMVIPMQEIFHVLTQKLVWGLLLIFV